MQSISSWALKEELVQIFYLILNVLTLVSVIIISDWNSIFLLTEISTRNTTVQKRRL